MTDFDAFRDRIRDPDVSVLAVEKSPLKHDFGAQRRVWSHLRALRPDVLHTRNLTALDALIPAFLAGVPVRIHGEHGRDMTDPDGTNPRILRLKRLHKPFIHHWTAVSRDLAQGLVDGVGISSNRITQIYNGVNLERFTRINARRPLEGFSDDSAFVFGTVGRLQDVKAQWLLLEALAILPTLTKAADRARVLIVGEGPMRVRIEALVQELNLSSKVMLTGKQSDVPFWLQAMDVFCLPSRAEGISNTLLEAMASGLPTIATAVGGNPEIVQDGITGLLVPSSDALALAKAMARFLDELALRSTMGAAAHQRAHSEFSLDRMLAKYQSLYLKLAKRKTSH